MSAQGSSSSGKHLTLGTISFAVCFAVGASSAPLLRNSARNLGFLPLRRLFWWLCQCSSGHWRVSRWGFWPIVLVGGWFLPS